MFISIFGMSQTRYSYIGKELFASPNRFLKLNFFRQHCKALAIVFRCSVEILSIRLGELDRSP